MVSIERIWSELKQIIVGRNAGKVMKRMSDDGVLHTIFGIPISSEKISPITSLEQDLEARLAMIFSGVDSSEVISILSKLKVSKDVLKRTKFLHSLLELTPSADELRLYRNVLGDEVMTHADLLDALGIDIELIKKSLQYPFNIECIVDGEWIMSRTGLEPGIRLGRLKQWLHKIQIERNYTKSSQLETALCTIPWKFGDVNNWPQPEWP